MLPMSGCLGPFTSNMSISYQSVSLNQGNGYNSALGKQAEIHRATLQLYILGLCHKPNVKKLLEESEAVLNVS